jgi:hypothetical protein
MKRVIGIVLLIVWVFAATEAAAAQEYKRFRKYVTWSR